MDNLKTLIRELIKKELDEMTGSGAAGAYSTPFAFAGSSQKNKDRKKKIAQRSMPGGAVVGDVNKESVDENDRLPILRRTLTEARARYYNLREYPMKNHSKVCYMIQEVNKMLKEIEFITDLNLRLKKESAVGTDMYWKRTSQHLSNINERMNRISKKIKHLGQ